MAITGFKPQQFGFGMQPKGPAIRPGGLEQNFASAGGTLPKGLVAGTPAADGYMKSRMRWTGTGYDARGTVAPPRQYDAAHTGIQSYYNQRYGPGGAPPPLTADFTAALRSTGPGAEEIIQRLGGAPPPAPAPAPTPAPVGVQPATPGMQGIDPQRFQNDPNYRAAVLGMQERMTAERAYLGSRSNPNLPYMQTMFDRLRAAQLQNRLPIPDPSIRRY